MFGDIKRWLVSLFLWVSVKQNRDIGLMWTKRSLDLFESMTKLTESKVDDKIVKALQEKVDLAMKVNAQADTKVIEKAAQVVTNVTKGTLKNVSVRLHDGKPIVTIGKQF